ncbi:MAG TPA: EamA family transporter [Baekduia sp.]|uniref:DMT family transporter n=1 Tax=Baekduia sp. TaxID=2600305 RepID=UPI002D77C69A|nr:EamA family transporter [Baekduia sp.]HET6508358.1 EamA family transporter [Baekduia sp.]
MRTLGIVLCVASAAFFGAMGIFGKLAYEQGVSVGTLLATRFALAAAVFWVVVVASGRLAALRRLPVRDVALALALGAVGYAAQAGAYFASLKRLDASLLSLLLYTFPVMVALAAAALGRERLTRRSVGALALASAGGVLVLGGAPSGALDPLGTALGLAAAVVYSAYILTSAPVSSRLDPLLLSTLVATGAAVTLTLAGIVDGDLSPTTVSAAGYGWLAAIALVSTVGAITLFFAGLARVGPTTASIVSTVEPVTAIALAAAVFGESLAPVQLAGGALVLGAVLVLSARRAAPAPPGAEPAPVERVPVLVLD